MPRRLPRRLRQQSGSKPSRGSRGRSRLLPWAGLPAPVVVEPLGAADRAIRPAAVDSTTGARDGWWTDAHLRDGAPRVKPIARAAKALLAVVVAGLHSSAFRSCGQGRILCFGFLLNCHLRFHRRIGCSGGRAPHAVCSPSWPGGRVQWTGAPRRVRPGALQNAFDRQSGHVVTGCSAPTPSRLGVTAPWGK